MSLHCGFLFPKKNFKLIFLNTIGYVSDNIFYRLNMHQFKTQIVNHPDGRSYQAFTSSHKKQLVVLVQYGKNPTFYFEYQDKIGSFQLRNVCELQVLKIQLSLSGKYLAVVCGVPSPRVIFIDIQHKRVLSGSKNFINLQQSINSLQRIQFNPSNDHQISLMFKNKLQIYQIKQCYQIDSTQKINQSIIVKRIDLIQQDEKEQMQMFLWDEINNLYLCNNTAIYLYSTDRKQKITQYLFENDINNKNNKIANMILTKKHFIVFYQNGRIQWLNKFYPDLMQEQQPQNKPFYLDKYYQTNKQILYSSYDGHMTKIFIAFTQGVFGILNKAAQSNQADQQDQQTNKKAQNPIKQKKLSIQLILSSSYHTKQIIRIHQFPSTSICLTLSSQGKLIYWQIRQKQQLISHNLHPFITCASINRQSNVLVTAHNNGIIRFYSISDYQNVFLFKQFKMTKNTPINQITFSTKGDQLAVLSKIQGKVFYILTSLEMEFQVLGYVNISHQIKYISWIGNTKSNIPAKYQYLLLNIGYGVLMINSPVAIPTKKRGKQLQLKLDIYAIKTDPYQTLVSGLPSGELLVTGKDKNFKKYKQPQDLLQKVDFKAKVASNPPLQQLDGHQFQTLIFKNCQNYLLSGGKQGKIQIRDYHNFKQYKQIHSYGWKNSNMNTLSGSWIKGLIYVGGKDGSFYIWKLSQLSIPNNNTNNKLQLSSANYKKISSLQDNIKYFQVIIQQQYLQRMKQTIGQKKKLQFQKLQKIRKQLNSLLIQNQKHDELQKLSRDEFAIDLQAQQIVSKQGEEKCKQIMQQSKKKILVNQVHTRRLKQITYDRMEIHLSCINGLKNNYIVENYPLRKISQLQKRKIKLILDLRIAQKKQEKKRINKNIDFDQLKNKNIINGGILTPLIMTQIQQKKQESKKDDKKKKKQQQTNNPATNNQPNPQSILQPSGQQLPQQQQFTLLYSSFQLLNNNSKRNQIIIMKHLIQTIKRTFNKQFNKLLRYRQNQNEIINDKNKRIIEICQQLKKQSEVIISRQNILETNQKILLVKNNQIPFDRYLSKQQREKLDKEKAKEQERLRKLAEDDSAQRALNKMMGGTLEQKKVSALEIVVEKEKWMDKPLDQMNQEEKNKLKQYQTKKQKAQQQKQRLVKKLQAQLRKLKQQIDQIMQKYDQKLFQLLKKKIQFNYRIQQQQLYCARLALSMLNQKQQQKRYIELKKQIQQSKHRLQQLDNNKYSLNNNIVQFQNQRQAKRQQIQKQRLGQFESKIKTIQKSVFQQYQTNIKKRRQSVEKILQHNQVFKHQIIDLDPMKQIQTKLLSQEIGNDFIFFIHQIKSLQQTFDIPQNTIEKLLENRFNLRRQEYMLQEKQKILNQTIKNIQEDIYKNKNKILADQQQLVKINQFLIKCKSDLDLQIRIKQGQVQIDNNKPVPDLKNALLIAKNQIDQKNIKIKQQANQKISVMKQIKTCKIKVTQQTLNLQKKQQHIDKLSQMIKQIQMLKVKKQMQVALNKKDTKMNQNQIKSLKQQIQKVRKQGQKRIQLYNQKIKKIVKQIQTIKKQNKQLQTQKWNLEGTVKQRQKIKDMMCGDGQSGQQAAEKFDQISINRKLFDKAKQQTQQIQLLREQLSKLKAKTFANFSNLQR